ncbi:MAG: carboxyltransferase domain-containing protein [Candidatus Synoicihabitans palmerolidicus]|nr:carboxyltransferase domain-containing protein [Candidatus Synoicihabitans palmerolidicus]
MMIRVLGDTALLVEWEAQQARERLGLVQDAAEIIREQCWNDVIEVVSGASAVAVYLSPSAHWARVAKRVRELLEARLHTSREPKSVKGTDGGDSGLL